MNPHNYPELSEPTLDPTGFDAGFWYLPKIVPDWRRVINIVDEVTSKDYNFGKYNPKRSTGIKDLTSAVGKHLWLHCYLQQEDDLNPNFLEVVDTDSGVNRLLL